MLKDLLKQLKNRIINKKYDGNFDPSVYIPIRQKHRTYNLYDLPDGFVIEGDVWLAELGLTELPDLSKVTVKGDFICSGNYLTSLKGAPQKVKGSFWCDYSHLTSLQGAPQEIGRGFYCQENELTSLEGAPQYVGGYFVCRNNKLTTLEGSLQKVGGKFDCYGNKLTTLKGAPQEVGGDFSCSKNNDLLSLFGLPQMSDDKSIYCDDDLMERYNCPKAENEDGDYYIKYKDLIESAKYQSELSVYKIRQKKHEENKVAQDKFKAGYAAFKKKQAEERE